MNAAAQSISAEDESKNATKRRERLLARIANSRSLPALGASIARVIQTASNDDEGINKLASFVLSDPGLTQKILHLANTVYFRSGSQIPVTTVSKAILILGFETVKSCSLTLLLVEKLGNANQTQLVRRELLRALVSSCVGREMVSLSTHQDAEEAVVVSLFKNLGQVLVATHDYELYQQICTEADATGCSVNQAAVRLVGFDYYNLAAQVMSNWSLPETLIAALTPLPLGKPKAPANKTEWMRTAGAFSAEVADACHLADPEERQRRLAASQARFGGALSLEETSFDTLIDKVSKESRILMRSIGANLLELETPPKPARPRVVKPAAGEENPSAAAKPAEPAADPASLFGLPAEFLMLDADMAAPEPTVILPSGKPENARELLLSSLQEVMQTIATSKPTINQVVMMVLEALYRGMGFRFAVACLKQPQPTPGSLLTIRGRSALGERAEDRLGGFRVEVSKTPDLFSLALKNDVDLMISDAGDPKIKGLIPPWHKALLPTARSFVILPLIVNKKPLGLFYADRASTTPEGVSPEETALIKSLKAQVITTIRNAQ